MPASVSIAMKHIAAPMKDGLLALAVQSGLAVMFALLDEDVTALCDPRGKHNPERPAVRHGHEAGSMVLGGRRLPIRRPRVRSASAAGAPLGAADVRRDFRQAIVEAEGVDAAQWTPRELRHSFVSLLSDNGVPLEEISRLVGHRSTTVTEIVYRKQIRPVLQGGAVAMDRIFEGDPEP